MNGGAIVYYNGNITFCFSAFSGVADPDLQKRRRPNHPDPEISGGCGRGFGGLQIFFSALLASFSSKNRGRPPGPSPGSVTARYLVLVLFCFVFFTSLV